MVVLPALLPARVRVTPPSGPKPSTEGRLDVLTFKMVLADGSPANPPQFVSSEPRWDVGMRVMVGAEYKYRIAAIDYDEERGTVWTVELVRDGRAA